MEIYNIIIGVGFILIIILKFFLIYGYIKKHNIGTRFNTELSNSLHNNTNVYIDKEEELENKGKYLINPTFKDIYNIVYNTQYHREPDFTDKHMIHLDGLIFELKLIGILIVLILVLMLLQEPLEELIESELFETPTVVIVIVFVIIGTLVLSILSGLKFHKMGNLTPDADNDTYEELVFKHISLYKPMDDLLDTISNDADIDKFKADYLDKYFLNIKDDAVPAVAADPPVIDTGKFITMLKATYPTQYAATIPAPTTADPSATTTLLEQIQNLFNPPTTPVPATTAYNEIKTKVEMKAFITALIKILSDVGITNLPSPFNGGDNTFQKKYDHIRSVGLITSGSTLFMCIICVILVIKNRQS
jgi:hypothetical protein